jgi:hypothetical protein
MSFLPRRGSRSHPEDRGRRTTTKDEGDGGLSRVSADPDEVGEEENDHDGAAGFELLKETG